MKFSLKGNNRNAKKPPRVGSQQHVNIRTPGADDQVARFFDIPNRLATLHGDGKLDQQIISEISERFVNADVSNETHQTNSTNKSRRRWKTAFNVTMAFKETRKVRFVVDPSLHPNIDEFPVEMEESTINESAIHYRDAAKNVDKNFCTHERHLWNFVNSNQWQGEIRITSGALMRGLHETLEKLVVDGEAIVYESVHFTIKTDAMDGFIRRGSVVKKQGNNLLTLDEPVSGVPYQAYRIRREIYAINIHQADDDTMMSSSCDFHGCPCSLPHSPELQHESVAPAGPVVCGGGRGKANTSSAPPPEMLGRTRASINQSPTELLNKLLTSERGVSRHMPRIDAMCDRMNTQTARYEYTTRPQRDDNDKGDDNDVGEGLTEKWVHQQRQLAAMFDYNTNAGREATRDSPTRSILKSPDVPSPGGGSRSKCLEKTTPNIRSPTRSPVKSVTYATPIRTPDIVPAADLNKTSVEGKNPAGTSGGGRRGKMHDDATKTKRQSPLARLSVPSVEQFFLPRKDEAFYKECLAGLSGYHVYTETVTNNRDWSSAKEFVIKQQ